MHALWVDNERRAQLWKMSARSLPSSQKESTIIEGERTLSMMVIKGEHKYRRRAHALHYHNKKNSQIVHFFKIL